MCDQTPNLRNRVRFILLCIIGAAAGLIYGFLAANIDLPLPFIW